MPNKITKQLICNFAVIQEQKDVSEVQIVNTSKTL